MRVGMIEDVKVNALRRLSMCLHGTTLAGRWTAWCRRLTLGRLQCSAWRSRYTTASRWDTPPSLLQNCPFVTHVCQPRQASWTAKGVSPVLGIGEFTPGKTLPLCLLSTLSGSSSTGVGSQERIQELLVAQQSMQSMPVGYGMPMQQAQGMMMQPNPLMGMPMRQPQVVMMQANPAALYGAQMPPVYPVQQQPQQGLADMLQRLTEQQHAQGMSPYAHLQAPPGQTM